jgi:hypothetical protein
MRLRQRDNLLSALRTLRAHRRTGDAERGSILRVMRNGEMQEEFAARVKEKFGIDIDNLRALIDLIIEKAPAILKIIMDIISMFSSRGTAAE